jgi:hypothetical protein
VIFSSARVIETGDAGPAARMLALPANRSTATPMRRRNRYENPGMDLHIPFNGLNVLHLFSVTRKQIVLDPFWPASPFSRTTVALGWTSRFAGWLG